ncbi:MAG: hypothetical protein MHPSP_000576, partial [Paramarteilia canceri]
MSDSRQLAGSEPIFKGQKFEVRLKKISVTSDKKVLVKLQKIDQKFLIFDQDL